MHMHMHMEKKYERHTHMHMHMEIKMQDICRLYNLRATSRAIFSTNSLRQPIILTHNEKISKMQKF